MAQAVGFFTDHRLPDARPPWLSQDERRYRALARSLRPNASDGGGSETAASHGPVYYGVLAPAYLLAGSSPFSQLTLMRLTSALIGALVVLFTYLIGRELAPRRPWLAVIAALLVAYQPMYGFISGSVNNDVGINAVAAAVELLLQRILRRGLTTPTAAATGGLLLLIPAVKGTGMSLYPVAAAVLLVALWRERARAGGTRAGARALLALAGGALAVWGLSVALRAGLRPTPSSPAGSLTANASAVSGAVHNIPDFASYVWQSFLPRLPFMVRHFASSPYPAFGIFVERGWATFGWYTVLFPYWLYLVLAALMIAALALGALALRCERGWARAHRAELFALAATPVAVIVGFEAAYYSPHLASAFGEAGRYTFPAIGPLALLCVGALHAFGRRRVLPAGIALVVALIALSYASQLLTLTSFYA